MVSKAHTKQDHDAAAARDQRAEQLEQAIIKTQLQTGRLPSKTPLQESLEKEFDPLHREIFGSKSAVGGARLASRTAGGDIDGSAEDQGEKKVVDSARGMLTSAAFTTGMSMAQDGAPAEVGQSLGSAERAFGEDGAEGNAGLTERSASVDSVTTLATDVERLSVYEYVEGISGAPLGHLGAKDTIGQETALDQLRAGALKYPEFERLNGSPVSLRGDIERAVDKIRNGAFCHSVIHAAMKEGLGDNVKQTVERFRTVGGRFISDKEIIVIDPSKAFGGTLAA
jgi:hypothetical protein